MRFFLNHGRKRVNLEIQSARPFSAFFRPSRSGNRPPTGRNTVLLKYTLESDVGRNKQILYSSKTKNLPYSLMKIHHQRFDLHARSLSKAGLASWGSRKWVSSFHCFRKTGGQVLKRLEFLKNDFFGSSIKRTKGRRITIEVKFIHSDKEQIYLIGLQVDEWVYNTLGIFYPKVCQKWISTVRALALLTLHDDQLNG